MTAPRMDNYADQAVAEVREELGDGESEHLVLFYALLALTTGQTTSLSDVHDAWALWTAHYRGMPDHAAVRPFEELPEATQEQDEPYQAAIHRAAERL